MSEGREIHVIPNKTSLTSFQGPQLLHTSTQVNDPVAPLLNDMSSSNMAITASKNEFSFTSQDTSNSSLIQPNLQTVPAPYGLQLDPSDISLQFIPVSAPYKATPHHGEAHQDDLLGQSKLGRVLGNMLNAIVGAAIVGLPYVFASAGVAGTIGIMVVFAICSQYTLRLLIHTAKQVKIKNYEDLCEFCLGDLGYYAVSFSMLIYDYGAMLSYLIILGDATFKVLNIWGYENPIYHKMIIAITSLVLIFPSCCFRDISSIERLSAFSVFTKISIMFVVIYEFFRYRVFHQDTGYPGTVPHPICWVDVNGMIEGLGIIAFAFVCHDSSFLLYNTLRMPTEPRWAKLIWQAIGGSVTICTIFSMFAYLTFGKDVEQNILNNYKVHQPWIIATRIAYSLSMALSYPTAFYVVRHIVYSLFNRNGEYKSIRDAPLWKHLLFTIPIFFTNLTLACLINSLGLVMSVAGSLAAVSLAFILPCLCYLKVCRYKLKFWNEKEGHRWEAFKSVAPSMILAGVGCTLAIFCPTFTILQTYNIIQI